MPAFPLDPALLLDDGGAAITSTGYGRVGGASRVYDTGPSDFAGYVVAQLGAADHADGNESYVLQIEGSNSGTFASGVVVLATGNLAGAVDGQLSIAFNNGGGAYRFLRLKKVLSGTTPSLDVLAFLVRQTAVEGLSLAQLVERFQLQIDAWKTWLDQYRAWSAGTPTGGPDGDGLYPITDPDGVTVLVPCPALASVSAGVIGVFADLATKSIPVGTNVVRTAGHTTAGVGGATYVATIATGATAWRKQTANGRWFELLREGAVNPKQVGAVGNGTTDDTAAVQAAIAFVAASGIGGVVEFDGLYLVDKVTLASTVRLRGLSNRCGLTWRAQTPPNLYTATSTVAVTHDSATVTTTGDITGSVSVGRMFRKSGSAALYVVIAISYSSGFTTITLHRPWRGASASGQTAYFHDPYGMVEYPEGPTVGICLDHLTFDGAATNPGGFVVYRRAKKGAASAGGDWLNTWFDVRIDNCFNGLWLRGTVTTPFNSSVEPIQFTDYHLLNIVRTAGSSSDGCNLMVTGQVNQQTFHSPLLQKNSGTDRLGVVILIDMEPLGVNNGLFSNKSAQGLRFMHPSIQGAEYGIKAYAGETVEVHNPYFEHLTKVIDVVGYNISNKLDLTLTKGEWKGGLGTAVDAGGFLIKAGPSARVVLDGGNMKMSDNKVWVDAGGELVIDTAPLLVQGIGGFQESWVDPLVPGVTVTSGEVILASQRLAVITETEAIDTLTSDLWPGEEVRLVAGTVNGMILVSGGNLLLPNDRARWVLPKGSVVVCSRCDQADFQGWIVRRLQTTKPMVSRGSNFTLPAIYLEQQIRIVGTCTVTLPDDSGEPGFTIGDEVEFLYTGGAGLTFAAGGSATLHAIGGVFNTTTAYATARAKKYAADTWHVRFG